MSGRADPMATFREEVTELLDGLERALMQLEEDPTDRALIDDAFRSMHTIKGSGNMLGLDALVAFTHTVETAFSHVRDGKAEFSPHLVELGLSARDHIEALMQQPEPDETVLQNGRRILDGLAEAFPSISAPDDGGQDTAATPEKPQADASGKEAVETTFRVQFTPAADALSTGSNPLLLIRELYELGEALIVGFTDRVPPLEQIEPEMLYLSWEVLVTTDKGENAVRDVFIFVDEDWDVRITPIDEADLEHADMDYKRLGEILVERGDVRPEDLEAAVNARDYIGDVLIENGYVSSERVEAALQEQQYVRRRRESRQTVDSVSTIKVRTEKLDTLVNLVGEFVSEHATLQRMAAESGNVAMQATAERLEALIRDTRDLALELHMVPVEILFSGFRRLVRDLSQELGKQVKLVLEGVETELDKNIVERLKDPLLHIIRNSLDHGIETPDARTAAGKPQHGTLTLAAFHSGAHVVIRIDDDGAGIDADAVRAMAVERELIAPDQPISEEEAVELIFAPGFSTAASATNVSGRGVGMDVVRRNIEEIGGSIRLDSSPGAGTSMLLRIPLTLAIVEGLLVRVADQVYMVTMSSVLECIEFDEAARPGEQALVDYRGRLVPFVDMRSYFDGIQAKEEYASEEPEHRQLLMVTSEDRTIGLVVDGVLDTFQSVVKSLGKMYEGVEGVSGAVVLGDGRLALLVDVDRISRLVARR